MKTVGFIGLGAMGRPMALNVLRAGFPLVVYDVRPEAVAALVAQGARPAGSPCEVASESDVVVLMVRTSGEVEQVIAGPGGILEGLRAGGTVIVMSTIAPAVVRRLAERVRAAGAHPLDAPVTRGTPAAEAGTLATMVGGEPAVLEAQRDVLRTMATDILYCGPTGSGAVTKLVNNLILGIIAQGLCEGLVLGVKAGVPLETLLEVLHHGSARTWLLDVYFPQKVLRGDISQGGSVDVLCKDLDLALELAREQDVPLVAGALCRQLFGQLQALGHGADDYTALLLPLEQTAGIQVRLGASSLPRRQSAAIP